MPKHSRRRFHVHQPYGTAPGGSKDSRFRFENHELAGTVVKTHSPDNSSALNTTLRQQAGSHDAVENPHTQPLAFLFQGRFERGTPDPYHYIGSCIFACIGFDESILFPATGEITVRPAVSRRYHKFGSIVPAGGGPGVTEGGATLVDGCSWASTGSSADSRR